MQDNFVIQTVNKVSIMIYPYSSLFSFGTETILFFLDHKLLYDTSGIQISDSAPQPILLFTALHLGCTDKMEDLMFTAPKPLHPLTVNLVSQQRYW